MQLFITQFTIKGQEIFLDNKAIVNQIRKVLRGKIGDHITLQDENTPATRYVCQITNWGKQELIAKILQIQKPTPQKNIPKTQLLVAMPNKRGKAELITQKLTEIGIDRILFWQAERSILKQQNPNKRARIATISREAAEQSWRRDLPELLFVSDSKHIKTILSDSKVIIFDIPREINTTNTIKTIKNSIPNQYKTITGVIGPEGGLTPKDYTTLGTPHTTQALGNNVLRMETAAILAAREIKKITTTKI